MKKQKPELTPREKQVVDHLSRDASVKMIASSLKISEYTVNDHIKNIKDKFDVHTAAGIVGNSMRRGLIS